MKFNYVRKAVARKDMRTDDRPTRWAKEAVFKLKLPHSWTSVIPIAPKTMRIMGICSLSSQGSSDRDQISPGQAGQLD